MSCIQIRFIGSFETLLKLFLVGEKDIFVSCSIKMKGACLSLGLI